MKKLAFSILFVALLGAFVAAQDAAAPAPAAPLVPTFNFYANDGVLFNSTPNGTTAFSNAGLDYGQGQPGPVVFTTITVTGTNFGWSFAPGLLADPTSATLGNYGTSYYSQYFFLDHAYAYINPAANLTLEVGQGLSNAKVFNDLDDRANNGFKSAGHSSIGGWYTIDGLSVGLLAAPALASSGYQTGANSVLPVYLGVNYTSKAFAVNAYGSNDTATQLNQLHVTGALTAIENLTLNLGYFDKNRSTTEVSYLDATVGYAFGPLTVGLVGYYINPVGQGGTSNTYQYLDYKPYVNYTVNKQLTLSAYVLGDTSNSSNFETLGQVAWTPIDGNTIKVSVWGDTNPTGTAISTVPTEGGSYYYPSYNYWTGVASGYFNASVDYIFSY